MGLPVLLSLVFFIAMAGVGRGETAQEKTALLAFFSRVPHEQRIQWNPNASACSWVGVTCDAGNTSVVALRLPGVGLVGPIPAGTLGRLTSLRVLSLRANRLSGPIPDDLGNLTILRSLYLQDNQFSGGIPPAVSRLGRLGRLDLSGNNLTGEIPFALNNLTRLTGLFLERNRLSGSLPSINIDSLVDFNVSYNNLNGSIPPNLDRFPASSFAGNQNLCGAPLSPCTPFFPSPASPPGGNPAGGSRSSKRLSTAAIIAIAAGGGALLLLVLLLLLICWVFRRRRERRRREKAAKGVGAAAAAAGRSGETGMTSSSKEEMGAGGTVEGERNRLVFVGRGGGYSFDLEDLLRASAEVLGKGSVGTSYKAVLEEGTTVVVKRLRDVVATKREFELHMETLGKVDHRNLLPLRAYYYSKDEKLLVFDYLPAGSLSSLLHGQSIPSSLSLSLSQNIKNKKMFIKIKLIRHTKVTLSK